ncbi:MAG: glutaminyl-peptide cyclotransferase [Porticoccaceae bacterium]
MMFLAPAAQRRTASGRPPRHARGTAIGDARALVIWMVLSGCATATAASGMQAAPHYRYEIVHSYPHDPEAFTQGLAWADGRLFESTGQHGRSSLREIELATGRVLRRTALAPWLFGEGIAVVGDRVVQLTWHEQQALVRDRDTFELRATFTYPGEGWGLAWDGRRLIMSDGSATLYFRDPETFAELGRIDVTDAGTPITQLNELEMVGDEIWANVWGSEHIARIDSASGRVLGWIDLKGLTPAAAPGHPIDVLNGIAWDAAGKRLFVTGKLWPRLFEIRLVPELR